MIDSHLPEERRAFMPKDTSARRVLTNNLHSGRIGSLTATGQQVVAIESTFDFGVVPYNE